MIDKPPSIDVGVYVGSPTFDDGFRLISVAFCRTRRRYDPPRPFRQETTDQGRITVDDDASSKQELIAF